MKNLFTKTIVLLIAMFIALPQAKAIITDPNDYIIYDSGILADSVYCTTWEFPSWMTITDDVGLEKIEKWGRSNNSYEDYGYLPTDDVSNVQLWGLKIGQEPGFSGISYTAFMEQPAEERPLFYLNRWQGGYLYGRPTDSIVIRIPATSDSIYIQGCGSNYPFYGIMAYELHRGKDSAWYIGGNWGQVFNLGFKPKHAPGTDSTDIVVLGPHKDWFTTDEEWKSNTNVKTLVNIAELNEDGTKKYKKSERYGFFEGTSINRIKIFGQIEKGEVPVFDGLVAGWDFLYRPKSSGTVDLESLVTTNEGEWEDIYYPLYASDLGVVRGKLSSTSPAAGMQLGNDCGVQAVKFTPNGQNDTVDFTLGVEHDNYFQVEMSTTGFQELTLDFDFNIRDAADSCVVAYSADGDTFIVAGKFPTPVEYDGLTHVSLPMPELTNQASVQIRMLLDNGEYGEYGEFILANLAINGFEYEEYDSSALDIAYINTAETRIRIEERATTSDSLDLVILPALRDKHNVTVFYSDLYAGITDSAAINELFADYDLVVLSEFPGSTSDIAKTCRFLIGNKPLLNFKAYAYKTEAWTWGSPSNGLYNTEVPVETHAVIGDRFIYHPIFKGLTIGEDNSIQVFDTLLLTRGKVENDYKGLQGFVTDTYTGPEGYSLASPIGSPNVTTFHEISANPQAKYMLLGFAAENYANIGEEGLQLVLNAVDYVAASSAFAVPNFNMTSSGAIVETAEELRSALAYDYSALNLDTILIQMKDCADPGGIYLLGSDGMAFPQSFNDLNIQAAEGASPQLWGSFRSNNGMKVNKLRFEGLTWNGGDSTLEGYNDENYQPFAVLQPDSVMEEFLVTGCRFVNFDYQRVFRSNACAGAVINKLIFEDNYFNNMGWNRSAGTHGQSFIQFVNSNNYQLDSLVFHKNVVKNFHGNQLFNVPRNGTTAAPDTLGNFRVDITNNVFYKLGGHGSSDRNFLEYNGSLGGLKGEVNINNNLFYERWSNEMFPQGYLALPETLADGQSLQVNVLNNFFYPDTVVTPKVDGTMPLQVKGLSVVEPVYNNLFAEPLGITTVFEDEQALTISKGSPLFISGTNRSAVGIREFYVDRQESGTLIVSNVPELRTALDIAIGGDVIELENCDDSTGVYLLGSSGFTFPQTWGNLTIKAVEGQEPQLFGRLWSSNGMKLDSLIIEGLHWNGGDSSFAGFNSEGYASFQISGPDSVRQAVVVRNSSFRNFDYQPVLRTRNSEGSMVNEWVFTHCLFDNMGWNKPTGVKAFHFVQFEDKPESQLDRFSFTENILMNFHGSQLFNISTSGSPSADSIVVINISNNTFYRLGGHSTDARQFLGFNKRNAFDNYIDINDNLFIERWSNANKYPNSNVALFTPEATQVMEVNMLNNFFYPDTVQALPGTTQNLPVTEGDTQAMTFARNDLFTSTLLMDEIFVDPEKLLISESSPLFTAGTNGAYVGAKASYTKESSISKPKDAVKTGIFTQNGTLFVHAHKAQNMSIYNLLGKEIRTLALQQGINAVEGLRQGQVYLIKLDNSVTKVVM